MSGYDELLYQFQTLAPTGRRRTLSLTSSLLRRGDALGPARKGESMRSIDMLVFRRDFMRVCSGLNSLYFADAGCVAGIVVSTFGPNLARTPSHRTDCYERDL